MRIFPDDYMKIRLRKKTLASQFVGMLGAFVGVAFGCVTAAATDSLGFFFVFCGVEIIISFALGCCVTEYSMLDSRWGGD